MTCPSCQSGELEEFSGKMICSNPRCLYKETCSDGGCMIPENIPIYVKPQYLYDDGSGYLKCSHCERKVHTNVLEHRCPGIPEFKEPPSTAASDYASLSGITTQCYACGERTIWNFKPQGTHWMCKCGKVQLLNGE